MKEIFVYPNTYAKIDSEDYDRVNKHKWRFYSKYPETKIAGKTILMQRLIMNAKPGEIIDHLNHNKLDNRKQNLKRTTVQGNAFNRVVHKNNKLQVPGVIKTVYGYAAYIQLDGTKHFLGTFAKIEDAARAYLLSRHLRNHLHHQYHNENHV